MSERRLSKKNYLPKATFSSVIGLSAGVGILVTLVQPEFWVEQEIKNANPLINETNNNELVDKRMINEWHSNYQSEVNFY